MASKFTEGSHRFSDVADEPQRRLPPLRGFETMPLVTLEEAIQPLVPHVPEIEHMVHTVKENNNKPADGLTVDESASIALYSLEWTPSQNSFYHILNRILRSPTRQDNLPPWFLYLRLFITALSKLPSTPGRTIYRGVKMDLRDKYTVGAIYVWWGFSSCTSAISVFERDQFCGTNGTKTVFSIECDTGKSISNHKSYPSEDEILLLPGRELKVVGHRRMGNQVHITRLKEIQRQSPHIVPIQPAAPMKLSYWNRGLTDADIQRVMQKALFEKRCAILELCRNQITDKGAATIAKAIQNNQVKQNTQIFSKRRMRVRVTRM